MQKATKSESNYSSSKYIGEIESKISETERMIEFEKIKSELLRNRFNRYTFLVFPLGVFYTFAIFFFIFRNDFPKFFSSAGSNNTESQLISNEISDLQKRLNSLEESIKNASDSGNLESRVGILEEKQENISESIALDLEKALTAKIIQEKQFNIEKQLTRLENSTQELGKRLDNFIVTVFAVPTVGTVLALVTSSIIFFVKWLLSHEKKQEGKK